MVRVTPSLGFALVLGSTLGMGLWLLVSMVPVLRRPKLMHRVAPYVVDVSSGARDLLARRRVDPSHILGVVASPVGDRLRPVLHALIGSPAVLAKRLRQARSPLTPDRFRARQFVAALVSATIGCAVGIAAVLNGASPIIPVALAVVAGLAAAAVLDWWLQRRAKARMARISSELPTVLEFLTLSLAAGEGLADALRRVAKIGTGELAWELSGVTADAAAGATLGDALERWSVELDHTAITRLVDQMRGALERGTPLARTLQAQALDARDASKRGLLEAAGQKEITMLVPLVFGLLPTTVAFALWPGVYVLQVGF